jgi:peptidoglycan/LPS O-acetylase OafA/YrhL
LHIGAPDLGIVALFPLLILTTVRNKGWLARLLNSAPLVWLGDISSSVYLLHWFLLFLVLEAVRLAPGIDVAKLPPKPSLLLLTAMIAVSLGLATLSYRFVEVTGRRWLRKRLHVRPRSEVAQGGGLRSGARA